MNKNYKNLSCEELKELVFEKENKPHNLRKKDTGNSFSNIVKRIQSQSFSYSDKNAHGNKGTITSFFIEYENSSQYYYVPIFNYFERETTWIKVKANEKIQLSQKYSYYKYDEFTESDIEKKLQNGSIQNIALSKENIEKPQSNDMEEQAVYILNEVLYTKRIYIVLCFSVYDQEKWLKIPIEGALSGRGKKTLRTDKHGNQFSDHAFEETDRYKIFALKFDKV